MNFLKRQALFSQQPSEVSKTQRMKFIAMKTDDGRIKGKIASYHRLLHVSRQGFYKYLNSKDRPWMYQALVDTVMIILEEDEYNDTYCRIRMLQALLIKHLKVFTSPVNEWATGLWTELA